MQFDLSREEWQWLGLAALGLLVLAALVTDIRYRRIPNMLVLATLALGLLFHMFGPETGRHSAGLLSHYPSALGFRGAALGALAGLAAFLPLYAVGAMGAGDVKLMSGIGSFVGTVAILNIALLVLLMGGALALGRMVWKGNARRVLANVGAVLLPVLGGTGPGFDPQTQSADRMPYVLAIAAGLLAYGAWIYQGFRPLIWF